MTKKFVFAIVFAVFAASATSAFAKCGKGQIEIFAYDGTVVGKPVCIGDVSQAWYATLWEWLVH